MANAAPSRFQRNPPPVGTIWYMGVKTRLLDELEQTLRPLLESAAEQRRGVPVLLDLFTGTGVVAERMSPYARVLAADVERYACTLATARLQPAKHVEACLPPLLKRADKAREALCERYERALALEDRWLKQPRSDSTLERYRAWIEEETAGHDPEREVQERDPSGFPPCLMSGYYRNVYFGVRQAIELDALRWSIDREPSDTTRTLLLAALVFAASRATSATAHFAQPRALGRLSEVRALMRRREIEIRDLFVDRVHALLAAQRRTALRGGYRVGHTVRCERAETLMARWGEKPLDVVYADPPYTGDNYSRFYHVLETLVRYDYPPLERRGDTLLKGRYPRRERRHRSAFCRRSSVTEAFRTVCRFAASRGAALVWSYAHPSGLLIREVFDERLEPFLDLLGEYYEQLELKRLPIRHSGAGSRNRETEELIVALSRPRVEAALRDRGALERAPAALASQERGVETRRAASEALRE